MLIELLIVLIALGVWLPRPQPWQLVGQVLVALLSLLWLLRLLAPSLLRV